MRLHRRCWSIGRLLADWGVDLMFDQFYRRLATPARRQFTTPVAGNTSRVSRLGRTHLPAQQGFLHRPETRGGRKSGGSCTSGGSYMAQEPDVHRFRKSFVTEKGAMYWMHSMIVKQVGARSRSGVRVGNLLSSADPAFVQPLCGRTSEMAVIGGSAMQYRVTNSSFSDTDPGPPKRVSDCSASSRFCNSSRRRKRATTVVNEAIAFLPNIKGRRPTPELQPFDDFLQHHYSMTKWFYTFGLQFDEVLLRMFELYLNDGHDGGAVPRLDGDATSRPRVRHGSSAARTWTFGISKRTGTNARRCAKQFTELPDAAK